MSVEAQDSCQALNNCMLDAAWMMACTLPAIAARVINKQKMSNARKNILIFLEGLKTFIQQLIGKNTVAGLQYICKYMNQ